MQLKSFFCKIGVSAYVILYAGMGGQSLCFLAPLLATFQHFVTEATVNPRVEMLTFSPHYFLVVHSSFIVFHSLLISETSFFFKGTFLWEECWSHFLPQKPFPPLPEAFCA